MFDMSLAIALRASGNRAASHYDKIGLGVRGDNLMALCDAAGLILESLGTIKPTAECIKAYVHVKWRILYQKARDASEKRPAAFRHAGLRHFTVMTELKVP